MLTKTEISLAIRSSSQCFTAEANPRKSRKRTSCSSNRALFACSYAAPLRKRTIAERQPKLCYRPWRDCCKAQSEISTKCGEGYWLAGFGRVWPPPPTHPHLPGRITHCSCL